MTQNINGFEIKIISADELGGFPMTGKNDAGIVEIYQDGKLTDKAWLTISKNGIARLERI